MRIFRVVYIAIAFVFITAILLPTTTQAATSSGSLSGVSWVTEIQLNTRTSVFGKYVFAYGRTKATGDLLSQLSRAYIVANLLKGPSKTQVATCSDSGIWNVVTGVAEKGCNTPDFQLTATDQYRANTKHSYDKAGSRVNLPDMNAGPATLGP